MGSVERGASHHDFTRRRTISLENRTGRKGGGRRQGRASCRAAAPRLHMREGLYEALHEAGIEPDWVIGTSIRELQPFKQEIANSQHPVALMIPLARKGSRPFFVENGESRQADIEDFVNDELVW